MIKVPCKNCDQRRYDCHAVCEKYKQFCKENDEKNRIIRKSKECDSYNFDAKIRMRKLRLLMKGGGAK